MFDPDLLPFCNCEYYLTYVSYVYSPRISELCLSPHLTGSVTWSQPSLGYQNSKELGRVRMKGNRPFKAGHV